MILAVTIPRNLHGEHVHTSLDAGSPDPKCDDLKPVNSNGETEFVTQEKTISAFQESIVRKSGHMKSHISLFALFFND